jgi:hypothetical protein
MPGIAFDPDMPVAGEALLARLNEEPQEVPAPPDDTHQAWR